MIFLRNIFPTKNGHLQFIIITFSIIHDTIKYKINNQLILNEIPLRVYEEEIPKRRSMQFVLLREYFHRKIIPFCGIHKSLRNTYPLFLFEHEKYKTMHPRSRSRIGTQEFGLFLPGRYFCIWYIDDHPVKKISHIAVFL